MFVVPAATPFTIPESKPTVAVPVLLLLHVPPTASLSVIFDPAHTFIVPVIAAGNGLTVITALTIQPVGST